MKLIIASVIILFGIVFFLFALFPSDMSVRRVVRINAPADSVSREISDLRTWSKWNDLIRQTRKVESLKSPADQTDSNWLRRGNLTVNLVRKTADTIFTKWHDFSGRSFLGKYVITRSNGQAILQWSLEFHIRWYPWEKLASMFYDKQLGPVMEQSLLNLRKTLEPA